MAKRTPLFERHRDAGARLVDFAGWEMPLHYGSQIAEHHAVRRDAGMFDVSHMTQVDLVGADAEDFLRLVCANDVARIGPGRALYTCLLNERGGVIDDGIVYRLDAGHFRLVVNAATRAKDLDWLRGRASGFGVDPRERSDLAIVAVQGPRARERAGRALEPELAEAAAALSRFQVTRTERARVARTGYTGEDGYEVMLPGTRAPALWDALADAGVAPAGLGARDTLRLEAGLALYGHEMDEEVTPLEAGLGWTVTWEPRDREFIGRAALEALRASGVPRRLVGLVPEGRAVAREGQTVYTDAGAGVVTSGAFGPTVGGAVALARVPAGAGDACEIAVRNRRVPARVTPYPFVRNGEPRIPAASRD